jgi:hypothetical protein
MILLLPQVLPLDAVHVGARWRRMLKMRMMNTTTPVMGSPLPEMG